MIILPENLPVSLSLVDADQTLVVEQKLRWLPNQRGTYLGHFSEQAVVVKCFPPSSVGARRDFLRELWGIRALQQRGIATPALLYQGRSVDGHYCVVTEYLVNSVDLDEALTPGNLGQDSAAIADEQQIAGRALGEVLYALHHAGLLQKDAHLGNFLYRDGSVWVIDGAGISAIGRVLNRRRRLHNLALVLAQLPVMAGVFAEAVIAAYGAEFSSAQIRRALDHQRRRRERKYLRKTLRSCSEFKVTGHLQLRQLVRTDQLGEDDLQSILGDLEGMMARGESLKQGNSATLVKIRLASRWLVVKRYNIKSPWHRLRRLFRTTRAVRSWQNGYRLTMWGLQTPLPLATVEQRFGPLKGRSYLITEYCPFPACGDHQQWPGLEDQQGGRLLGALVSMVAALQALGLSHGDLKADNLKFDGHFLHLLDLDSLTRWRLSRRLVRATLRDSRRLLRNWSHDSVFTEKLRLQIDAKLSVPITGSCTDTGFVTL